MDATLYALETPSAELEAEAAAAAILGGTTEPVAQEGELAA